MRGDDRESVPVYIGLGCTAGKVEAETLAHVAVRGVDRVARVTVVRVRAEAILARLRDLGLALTVDPDRVDWDGQARNTVAVLVPRTRRCWRR